jgi:hypothetical protein
MGFGRNPYVTKAEVAEQKAAAAPDDASRVRALREAAHEWDRAAEREKPGKRREECERNAARNRAEADGEGALEAIESDPSDEVATERALDAPVSPRSQPRIDPRLLN